MKWLVIIIFDQIIKMSTEDPIYISKEVAEALTLSFNTRFSSVKHSRFIERLLRVEGHIKFTDSLPTVMKKKNVISGVSLFFGSLLCNDRKSSHVLIESVDGAQVWKSTDGIFLLSDFDLLYNTGNGRNIDVAIIGLFKDKHFGQSPTIDQLVLIKEAKRFITSFIRESVVRLFKDMNLFLEPPTVSKAVSQSDVRNRAKRVLKVHPSAPSVVAVVLPARSTRSDRSSNVKFKRSKSLDSPGMTMTDAMGKLAMSCMDDQAKCDEFDSDDDNVEEEEEEETDDFIRSAANLATLFKFHFPEVGSCGSYFHVDDAQNVLTSVCCDVEMMRYVQSKVTSENTTRIQFKRN